MDLLLGSHVREHGNRVGRLAGFELDLATRAVRRLIISANGEITTDTISHPLSHVALVHDGGEIELRSFGDTTTGSLPAASVTTLGGATRLREQTRDSGHLIGLEVDPGDRTVTTVFGRHHWWSRRTDWTAKGLDFSTPGEIRSSSSSNRAA